MSSPFFVKNTINFYIIRNFFSINRPGVKAKVTTTFLETLHQELIIAESIWVIIFALLFISHSPVFNFGPVSIGNAHKIKNKKTKTKTIMFLMKNFMLNLFDKISLKKTNSIVAILGDSKSLEISKLVNSKCKN